MLYLFNITGIFLCGGVVTETEFFSYFCWGHILKLSICNSVFRSWWLFQLRKRCFEKLCMIKLNNTDAEWHVEI